jgi:hypothetical protein
MRSIITATVVLALVGLVHAQNRRLEINFDLSDYQDLVATGMGITKANDFISHGCRGVTGYSAITLGTAFNVETNETMSWRDYLGGPGADGDGEYDFAIYPWSVVMGICVPLLNSTWAMDREVVYSRYVKNTAREVQALPITMDLTTPMCDVTTTLRPWQPDIHDVPLVKRDFFEKALPKTARNLINSMVWAKEDKAIPIRKHIWFKECVQGRLAALTVARTMVAVQAFTVKRYSFSVRRKVRRLEWWILVVH